MRILFVDDEPNILSGIRRTLRSKARDWEMVFVESGAAALKALDTGFFDIIVSDLRMPGMDGIALLQEVRKRSPETVRIALSGYSDREATLRAASQMHQFLMKPCDPAELEDTLRRAATLGGLLQDKRIKTIIARMETLPSVSTMVERVIRELEYSEPSAAQLGAIIGRDPAMSAKVLQLANSAIFGLSKVISDPVQATVLLGLEAIHLLVLSIRIFDRFTFEEVGGISVSGLWNHCVAVARLAKRLAFAECASRGMTERAFLSGILHDVGRLMLANDMPEKYSAVVNLSAGHPEKTRAIENRVLGANHAEVGAYLMGLWGFSETVVEAIHLHHQPSLSGTTSFGPLAAVHVANAMVHTTGRGKLTFEEYVDMAFLEQLGVVNRIPVWKEMAKESLGKEIL